MSKWTLTAAVLVAMGSLALGQSTWFVDTHATPPHDGSAAHPFASIQQALDHPPVQSGHRVVVAPGVYGGFLCNKSLTIESSGGPTLTAIEALNTDWTVRFAGGSNYATLRGFTLWGPAGGTAIKGLETTVERCILLGLGASETSIDDCGGGLLGHCWVSGFERGIYNAGHCGQVAWNSILWANGVDLAGAAEAYYCAYGSASPFAMPSWSIAGDPGVIDFKGHDVHLAPGSVCIDAGAPNWPLDPDGSRPDIGPLTFDPSYQPHVTYCTAKVNSLGCTPTIGAIGSPSVTSSRPFWVRCSGQISQSSGVVFYGFAPAAAVYQGGYLCVAPPTRRSTLLNAGGNAQLDCSGVFTFDLNQRIQSELDPLLTLGRDVYLQYWSRDGAASFGSNRSDALRVRIGP